MSTRRAILAALEGADAPVSGAALAARFGVSRAAVWKHVGALKKAGYGIDGERAVGYRLVSRPSALSEAAIRSRLVGDRVGRRLVVLDVTRSTNSDAMALGRQGEADGTTVIADEQTAGRGRLGRAWESRRGLNLYTSILLRPAIEPWKAPQLSLVAGVAVAETVREEGVDARIKWPNDVVVVEEGKGEGEGRLDVRRSPARGSLKKLAGILTEIEAEADRVAFVVVGIGVNLNAGAADFPPELESRATSVSVHAGRLLDRAAFAARLLDRFAECEAAWRSGGFAAVAPRWRALSVLEGRPVVVDGAAGGPAGGLSGTCRGIDDDGALLVDVGDGALRRVLAGDVTLSGGYDPCHP